MDQINYFRSFLRENGLTYTSARNAILAEIVAAEGHFDADDLHDTLKKKGHPLSTATIYRTLPLFVKSGIIKQTLHSGGRARYEHVWGHEHHDHLECVACGRIIEFKDDELETLQNKVCRAHGFAPVEHRLAIWGYCSSCKKR